MGYPHEICSIGRLKIGERDAKSALISKKIFADLRKVFACTVTYSNEMKEYFRGYFQLHQPERLEAFKAYYDDHKDEMSQYFREYNEMHKNQKRASSKNYYEKNKAKISAARKLYYANQKDDMMAANRARKMKHAKDVLRSARKYHLKKRERRCNEMRQRYQLAAPKLFTQGMYIQDLNKKLLCDAVLSNPWWLHLRTSTAVLLKK